jgi:hypothetical protein
MLCVLSIARIRIENGHTLKLFSPQIRIAVDKLEIMEHKSRWPSLRVMCSAVQAGGILPAIDDDLYEWHPIYLVYLYPQYVRSFGDSG